jgi:hypothetical protein
LTDERLTPVDYEFHVWRKNQAIVTRVVEIDFYADEQRRVLYDRVMDRIDDEELSKNNRYSHYTRRKNCFVPSSFNCYVFLITFPTCGLHQFVK